jgi:transketolase
MPYFEKWDNRFYVLVGAGEIMYGANWEAMNFASIYNLDNIYVLLDINRLGQSAPTAFEHDFESYQKKFEAFGFDTHLVDGHNCGDISEALKAAQGTAGKPHAILLKTFKGNDFTDVIQDKDGFHGKALGKNSDNVLAYLESKLVNKEDFTSPMRPVTEEAKEGPHQVHTTGDLKYEKGSSYSTREACGDMILKMGKEDSHIIGVDGDVKNSTFLNKLYNAIPE